MENPPTFNFCWEATASHSLAACTERGQSARRRAQPEKAYEDSAPPSTLPPREASTTAHRIRCKPTGTRETLHERPARRNPGPSSDPRGGLSTNSGWMSQVEIAKDRVRCGVEHRRGVEDAKSDVWIL